MNAARLRRFTPVDGATAAGSAFVLLFLATELRFRRRDATLALEGVIDAAIVVELAVWTAIGLWVALRLLPDGRLDMAAFADGGPVLRALLVVGALFGVTSLLAGGMLPVVRGWQHLVLVALAVVSYREASRTPEAAQRFWRSARRTLWVGLTVVVVAGFVFMLVSSEPALEIAPGIGPRFRLFLTHPINTGGLLGLAMVVLASSWLSSEDPWLKRPRLRWAAAGVFIAFFVLLIATKARGPLFATLAGLTVLIAITPHYSRRGIAVLTSLGGIGLLITGLGNELIRDILTRGQTTDQLLSLTGRTTLFEIGYQLFLERPFFGHGYHAARGIYLERVPWAGNSHNAWVEVAVNNGIIGLLVVGFLFTLLTVRLVRAWRRAPLPQRLWAGEGLALLLFVFLLGIISPGFAGPPGYEATALVWAVLLADLAFADSGQQPRPRSRHVLEWPPGR